MNSYIAFYKGTQIEVQSNTSFEAQQEAARQLKAKKHYNVMVVPAEKDGGSSTKSIAFFSDAITIIPHSASSPWFPAFQWLDHEVSIREFANGEPCTLEQVEETGDYIVRLADGSFMQGPEC